MHRVRAVKICSDMSKARSHILIAEDDTRAAAQLRRHFEHRRFRVSVAHDGAAAYASFVGDPADIVLTDYRMPMMKGVGLMIRLRQHSPGLPIIIASALPLSELRAGARGDPGIIVMQKPLSLRDVEASIRRLLCTDS